MKLEDTVRYLDVHGMDCFSQGSEKLWPISGNLKTMCGEDEANLHDHVSRIGLAKSIIGSCGSKGPS